MEFEDSYWAHAVRRRVSRRSVLRGAVGTVGLSLIGSALACTAPAEAPTAGPATTTPGPATTATRAAGSGAATVGGKEIRYARFLSNPPDFAAQPKSGGHVPIATNYVPANFDALAASSATEGEYLGLAYNRLLRGKFGAEMNPYDPWKFEPAPELAESWQVSPDGTEYSFKIRQGVKFQNVAPVNGREFSAEDARWTLENNRTDVADTLKSAGATFSVPDKYTLKLGLKRKVSWVLPLLSDPRAYMVPREIADLPGGFKENKPIGTGPFILTEYASRTKASYVKNPDYFERGKPYLDSVEFQVVPDPSAQRALVRGGQALMVNGDTPGIQELDAFVRQGTDLTVLQRESVSGKAVWHISMRVDKAPFSDVRVRRAVSLSINRKAIIDGIYAGKAQNLLPFPWTLAYDTQPTDLGPWYAYDPEQARKLFAEAGVQPGTRWEFLIGQYTPTIKDIAQLIQSDFKKVGIEVEIKAPDLGTYVAQYRPPNAKPTYEHLAYGLIFQNPVDTSLNLLVNLRSDAATSTDQIKDAKLDGMLDSLASEPDPDRQRPILRQIWDQISDQAYWPGLPEPVSLTYWHKSIQNFLPNYRNDVLTWGTPQLRDIWLAR
jgi:ABC-type transport system substrate-binding protein